MLVSTTLLQGTTLCVCYFFYWHESRVAGVVSLKGRPAQLGERRSLCAENYPLCACASVRLCLCASVLVKKPSIENK